MTQHALSARPEYPGHTVHIGWRRSPSGTLNTFYATVSNLSGPDCADDCPAHLTVPLGDRLITGAAEVIGLVRPYADIPADLLARLKADQANSPGVADPGPRALLRGSAAELHALFTQPDGTRPQ